MIFFFTLGKRLWIIKPYYGLWRLPQTYVLSAKLGYFHASELFWVVASEETRTRSWEVVTAATIFSVLFLDIWATSLLLHYTRVVEGKQFPIQLTICFSKDFRKHMVHTHCVLSKGNLLCCSMAYWKWIWIPKKSLRLSENSNTFSLSHVTEYH